MPVIDFHNHYYPPRYMKALQSGESSVKVTIDSDGNPNLHYPGDYNVAVRGHRDLAYRQEVLDTHGVTMQVVTLTTPGTHVETPADAVRLASMVNDEFKEAIDTRGKHFTALATLPLNDPAASAKEFERATKQLGLPGAMLFSNMEGGHEGRRLVRDADGQQYLAVGGAFAHRMVAVIGAIQIVVGIDVQPMRAAEQPFAPAAKIAVAVEAATIGCAARLNKDERVLAARPRPGGVTSVSPSLPAACLILTTTR